MPKNCRKKPEISSPIPICHSCSEILPLSFVIARFPQQAHLTARSRVRLPDGIHQNSGTITCWKRCTSSTVGLLSWNRITMIHGWIFSNLTYHLHFWAQCLNLRGRESDGSSILNPIPQNPRLFEWRSLIAKSYSRIWWSLVWRGWCDSFHRFTTQPTKPLSCFSPKCSKQIPEGTFGTII